jgi:hypothetical protein
MPEKDTKLSQRLMSLPKGVLRTGSKESFSESSQRDPFGRTLAMLARALAEENGSHRPSAYACRFLNARIAPFAQCRRFRTHQLNIVRATSKSSGARGEDSIEGFQFWCFVPIHRNSPSLDAPKLSARAAGIESVCYDFDRFLLSQRSTTRLVELISLWLRLLSRRPCKK